MPGSSRMKSGPDRNSRPLGGVLLYDGREQTLNTRDDESFAHYVDGNGADLLRIAYLLTGSRDAAHDLVQAVLARALLKWGRITEYDNIDAYLRRALINERTSQWRRVRRRESPSANVPDSLGTDDIARADDRAALLGVLRQLPRKQCAAIVLRYFEDMPDDEIAEILNCSISTVRSHVARGLAKARVTLDLAAPDPLTDHALNGGPR